MGVYTYTLKASKSTNCLVGDQVVEAYHLTFFCRAAACDVDLLWPGDEGGHIRRNAAIVRRAAEQWRDTQEVYFILETPEHGAGLYMAEGRDAAVWHDGDPFPGVRVGTLDQEVKVGRKKAWALRWE